MTENDWWYNQDEFPDDVTPEEILAELGSHWSTTFNLIHNNSELILHWEKSGADGSMESFAENISSAAKLFNTYMHKARRHLNRRHESSK